jgi:glycosyltransferase involved in cell wall biosynthesis
MKLVFLIHSLANGGAERVTANLANHWAGKGWDVTIVTVDRQGLDYYVLDPAVKRVALDLAGDSAGPLSALAGNLRRVLAVRRVLKRIRPDIAVAMMTQSNVLLALASLGLGGMRTVGSERTHPPQMPVGRMWEGLRRYWYGKLSAVVALTSETRSWLGAHTASTRIDVIPNPVPWPFPSQAPVVPVEQHTTAGRRTVLAVGRLSEEKGFHTLIDTFVRLAPEHPDWDLVILGKGGEQARLQAQIDAAGLGARIRLLGQAGNVGDWYRAADLYVMCSRFEGFPNTLAEAMAHGLPAVSFDCDTGPRDIIRHDVDGLLVCSGDAAALRHALARLMGDAGLRAEFAGRAVQARTRFSPETTVTKWERLFDELRRN